MNQDRPVPQYPSHRPHCNGHDYYERGIYLITIVVSHREHLLGELNMDIEHPGVNLTPLGRAVLEEWEKIPTNQLRHNHKVKTLAASVMPDHFHGVLFVEERMDVSVGQVIWGFKVGCTKRWRALMGADAQSSQPKTAVDGNEKGPALVQRRSRFWLQILPVPRRPLPPTCTACRARSARSTTPRTRAPCGRSLMITTMIRSCGERGSCRR